VDADLESALVRIVEERAVEAVILRFGRSLDLGDWPGYRSCFVDRPFIDFERLTGVPTICADADEWTHFADLILSPVRRHHTYSNIHIEISGDGARAFWNHTSRHWRATDLGASTYHQIGWYEAEFVRPDGEWRLSYIKHDFRWVEGNNALFDMTEPALAAQMARVFSADAIAAGREWSSRAVRG